MLSPDEIAPERPRPLSREQYDRMVEIGLFGEDEQLELLYGTLVEMSPQNPRHAHIIRQLGALLSVGLRGRALVQVQLPLAVSAVSEPEPDLAVVPLGDYRQQHPTQALLVVEVADSTLKKDHGPKARLYAEAGVPEYWLFNLADRRVELHALPSQGAYQRIERHGPGETIRPASFPDVDVPLDELL